MDEHAMRIIMVIRIPADVVTLVHHQTTLALLSRQPLGHGQTGKPGAYNEKIEHFLDRMTGFAGEIGGVFRQN